MKRIFLVLVAILVLILGSCERTAVDLSQNGDQALTGIKNGDIIPGQYIVLLKDGVTSIKSAKLSYPDSKILMRTEVKKLLAASNIPAKDPLQVYTSAVEGFAVKLSDEEALTLEQNPGVLGVWPDMMVVLGKPDNIGKPPASQQIPYGITRVGGGATYEGSNKVWIIDTGIDLDHPDLNVNTELSKNFISDIKPPDDDHGHGTHCAGIIAAIDNTFGVVGVAAGAAVVPVKVLDRRGSGPYSVVISGVDYVYANGTAGDAVNISLGGPKFQPLDDAVLNLGTKLFVAIAAGNDGSSANNYSPARVNGTKIYTISACDNLDNFASWSNWGNPPVDYCAPGVGILSLYKGGGTATMSGTSMAAPHVCGILLANGGSVNSDGDVKNDPDGNADPIAHK